MIYVAFFIISFSLLWISEKINSRYARRILALIAIILPCILAGMRADTIGTDVKVYVEPLYNAAKQSHSFSSYMSKKWYVIWRYMYVSKFEIGFTTLVYLIAKIGGSLGMVLFIIHILIIAPIYMGLRRLNNGYPICLEMLVFYFMFYNASLNMMRQWIAMAFLFYGFSYLIDKNYIKYFLTIAIAFLFHSSALMGILIYFIYNYSTKKRDYIKLANFQLSASLVSVKIFIYGCIVLLSLNIIAVMLRTIGLSKYAGYIQGEGSIYLLPNQILLRAPIIILLFIRWKKLLKTDKLTPFYSSMIVLDLLSSQLMSINAYSFRITVFFSEYSIISYPALIYAGQKYRTNRLVTMVYMMIYIISYWYYYYVFMGTHATFPYVFA